MNRRISWFSNAPWEPSGYGQQTALTVPELQRLGYDVAITAFHGLQGSSLPWHTEKMHEEGLPPVNVYPNWWHTWGSDVMTPHAMHFRAQIVISLFDIWVADLDMIGQAAHNVFWVPWTPIDSEPLPEKIKKAAETCRFRIAMSEFGQNQFAEHGLDSYYIPHGVDQSIFKPMDQEEAREMMRLPQDAFIFGMVAANKGNSPGRKAITEHMLAFKMFKEQVDGDAILLIHTTSGQYGEWHGVDLFDYANQLGLEVGKDIMIPGQYNMVLGFSPEFMAVQYNAFDVFMNVSRGEGFGVPILEAQACGTPVIVGDWTAMSEVGAAGKLVPKEMANPSWTPLKTYQFDPLVQGIFGAMVDMYEVFGDLRQKEMWSESAVRHASDYEIGKLRDEYWAPVLDDIYEQIEGTNDDLKAVVAKLKGEEGGGSE